MDTVLLLISSTSGPGFGDNVIETAKGLLALSSSAKRLAPNAAEILFSGDSAGIEDALRQQLGDQPIDIAILPAANRTKKLLIADMDSTVIHQECIDELGKMTGAGEAIVAITERAMRGELDFEGALRERVALMKGLEVGAIETVKQHHITFTEGGRTLVQGMRLAGAHTALVSGGFTHFTAYVADECGFHENRANELILEDGRLTGKVKEPVLGRDAKVAALRELCNRLGITNGDVIAVGDGANDLGMLEIAGLGVAFHGKPAVREAAGIRIDYSGLDALLWLQGLNPAD